MPAFGPSLFFGVAQGAIFPIVALTARNLGASVAMAALVVTLIGIGSLVSNIPASILTAKYGERWAIVGAGILGSFAMVLCVFATDLWLFSIAVFITGISASIFMLARQSYLAEAVPFHLRGRALSTLGGVQRIGLFLGPFIGAGSIYFLGLQGGYWVGAAALIAAAAVGSVIPDLKRDPVISRGPDPTVRMIVASHIRVFVTLGVGILLVMAVRASRQVVIPLWADQLGLEPAAASIIYGASGAIDMLIFYPAGKAMDKWGRAAVAVPSLLIMGSSLALMPFTSAFTSLLIAALLIGFGNGMSSGMVMTLGADLSPTPGRAEFLGVWRLMADLGNAGGPALLAGITAAASLAFGIWATAGLGIAGAFVLWYYIPRMGPATGDPLHPPT